LLVTLLLNSFLLSVMSGIITSPYFRAYFNQPSRSKLGAMVAVLEIGAFSKSYDVVSASLD
jgi:hypothetical protein